MSDMSDMSDIWINCKQGESGLIKGCFYCLKEDDDLVFTCEFDAYVHIECLRKELRRPALTWADRKEAEMIKQDLENQGLKI